MINLNQSWVKHESYTHRNGNKHQSIYLSMYKTWVNKIHSNYKHEKVQISLNTHQLDLVPDMFSEESIKLKTHIYIYIYIYIQTHIDICVYIYMDKNYYKKSFKVTSKFQTTLPHTSTRKNIPKTHSHTQWRKITISEIPNLSNTVTLPQKHQISKMGKAD